MRENKKSGWESFRLNALSLLAGVALLFAMEGAARLFARESNLERITGMLVQDPVLFWRNAPNLSTEFAGERIVTDGTGLRVESRARGVIGPKTQGKFRVICLGASPTFGWGVKHEDAYPARLEGLLRAGGVDAEVLNAGMIGYSSHQGKIIFMNELAALEPDAITVSYVINDIDRYRFFRTDGRADRELEPGNAAVIGLRNLLDRSRFFRLFEKGMRVIMERDGAPGGLPIGIFRPGELRVPLEHYRENLEEIADFAGDRGIGVVFVKMPVNLPPAEDLPAGRVAGAARLLSQGIALIGKGDWEGAAAKLERAAELNEYLSEAYYYLGVCRRRMGEAEKAGEAIVAAFRSEARRCGRDARIFNEAMSEVARQKGAPLADAAAAFAAREGETLFNTADKDPLHPNETGHGIIAREIYKAMKESGIAR
ncbi:MAG: GDSL-type esterase/lipase family protein [bacterium]